MPLPTSRGVVSFSRYVRAAQQTCLRRGLQSTTSQAFRPVLAIRRETINEWERRAPLSPLQVKELIKNGVKVLIQPSNRRAYLAPEYEAVGAETCEDLSEASLIIGVKKPSGLDMEDLLPNKTYAFFSHTIKAQQDNMALLDTLLERNIRIIDYERMLNEKGQRVVAFGQYAGIAGMINILHGMGIRLLGLGHTNPFLHIGLAHNYRSVEQARQAVRDAGYEIALGKMPVSIGPLVFVFTGSGNVSMGAQYIFKCLPCEYVHPQRLAEVALKGDPRKVYGCVVSRQDHYERREDGGFDAQELDEHPDRYISTFSSKIAPYASCIINGIYYAPGAPRLLTIPDAKHLLHNDTEKPWQKAKPGIPGLPHHLLALADISADPGGSIEFMQNCTTIDRPFSIYDAEQNQSDERFFGPGILVCSIDNMPAQIPREATHYFGNLLFPYVMDMLKSDATTPFEQYKASPVVKNAIITSNGTLTENYTYIDVMRKKKSTNRVMTGQTGKKVLILGAGHIVPSVVEYLSRDKDIAITVASKEKKEVVSLCDQFKCIKGEIVDALAELDTVEKLVAGSDIVISMVPWKHHPSIAEMCIQNKVNLLTASYCTPQLKEMKHRFEQAGITAMMEIGLDPGIDHLLAMECFDDVKQKGGTVQMYESYTGGLPAPENSDNPLRYKFSWSPEAALSTALNGARYIKNGKVKEIPAGGMLMSNCEQMDIYPGFNLEGYPNRDSTTYAELYGLDKCTTVIRGTLRYSGFCKIMEALIKIGLLDLNMNQYLHPDGPQITWKELMCKLNGLEPQIFVGNLKDNLFDKIGEDNEVFKSLEKLDIFKNELVKKQGTPLATLAEHLRTTYEYGPDERDMIVMSHKIGVSWPNHTKETKIVRLVAYGDPSRGKAGLAMSRTVGIPAAIAARMILEGEIQEKGIVLPLKPEIYRPILKRLRKEGIYATEISETRNNHK